MKHTLLYGYGNPGRQDDGLGIALVESIRKENIPGLRFDSNYQLNAEDALLVAENNAVIFADASYNEYEKGFSFTPLKPEKEISFTTHAMSPGSVLALSKELYELSPPAWVLEIQGYEWEMKEELTPSARNNLDAALSFLIPLLRSGELLETG